MGVDISEVGVSCLLGVTPTPNGSIARAIADYDAWAEQEYEAIDIMPESTHNSTTIHNSIHNPILARSRSSPQGQGLGPGLGIGGETSTLPVGATEGVDRLASSQGSIGNQDNGTASVVDGDDAGAAGLIGDTSVGLNIAGLGLAAPSTVISAFAGTIYSSTL